MLFSSESIVHFERMKTFFSYQTQSSFLRKPFPSSSSSKLISPLDPSFAREAGFAATASSLLSVRVSFKLSIEQIILKYTMRCIEVVVLFGLFHLFRIIDAGCHCSCCTDGTVMVSCRGLIEPESFSSINCSTASSIHIAKKSFFSPCNIELGRQYQNLEEIVVVNEDHCLCFKLEQLQRRNHSTLLNRHRLLSIREKKVPLCHSIDPLTTASPPMTTSKLSPTTTTVVPQVQYESQTYEYNSKQVKSNIFHFHLKPK